MSSVILKIKQGNLEGQVTINLFLKEMPTTAGNFANLADGKFRYPVAEVYRFPDGKTQEMPMTSERFYSSVKGKFYDNLTFHRVVSEFTLSIIQGGCPKGDGSGGPGYSIADEFPQGHPFLRNGRGFVAMANTGKPHTGGSQFFINLAVNKHLDGKHPVFGFVRDNLPGKLPETEEEVELLKKDPERFKDMQFLDLLAMTETDGAGKPVVPIVITKAELVDGPPGYPGKSGPSGAPGETAPPGARQGGGWFSQFIKRNF